jgi:hypothetical protein
VQKCKEASAPGNYHFDQRREFPARLPRRDPTVILRDNLRVPQISVNGLDAYYRDEGSGIQLCLGIAPRPQVDNGGRRMSGRYRLVAPDHIGSDVRQRIRAKFR